MNWVVIETLAFELIFKLGLVLTLMAVSEQPMYAALILKNLGYSSRKWWPCICRFAGCMFIATKLFLTALAFVIMVQSHTGKELSWEVTHHSFAEWHTERVKISSATFVAVMTIALVALLVAQMAAGVVLLKIAAAHTCKSSQTETEPAPQLRPNEDEPSGRGTSSDDSSSKDDFQVRL